MAFEVSNEESSQTLDSVGLRTRELTIGANAFSRAMTGAFRASVVGGKQFDDVLKSLTLRLSDMAVRLAFKPLEKSISGGIESLLSGLVGAVGSGDSSLKYASGAVKPFASGGVIGTPTYFPLMQGGVGSPAKQGRRRSCRSRAGRTANSA